MVTRDALKRLEDAQIITAEQATAIESFFWQESNEGEHARILPFVRFLVELGSALLLIGVILGAFFWMAPLPAWQGALISLIAGLLFGCFGIILKRTAFHDASPLLLLGASLLIPVILFRMYDALTPVFVGMGLWLPLTQASGKVVFGLALLTFGMQYAFFALVKSRILSLPVGLSWMYLIWMLALYVQGSFPDLTYIVPAPNLALLITIFGGMVLTTWGLLFNTSEPNSTGIWPEVIGLGVTSGLLAVMTLNIEFLTAARPAQFLYLAATILFGVAGMYIFARTQRAVWAFFSSLFLLMSVFSGWVILNAGAATGPLTIIGMGIAVLALAAVWYTTHRRG